MVQEMHLRSSVRHNYDVVSR